MKRRTSQIDSAVRGSPDPTRGATVESHRFGRPAVGGFREVRRPAPSAPQNHARPYRGRKRLSAVGRRNGIVLVIVLVVVTVISLAGLSFVLSLSTENKAAHLHGDELQLEQALASGEELLKAVCDASHDERQQRGGLHDNSPLFRGVVVAGDSEGEGLVRFSVLSPQVEDGGIEGIRFGAQDESARLNLAILSEWERQSEGAAAEALMNLPGMTDTIADSILDWIDTDDAPRAAGAETQYYAGRGLPYGPRNGVPMSLEELLLVRDISRHSLFGDDWDLNYQVDDQEVRRAISVSTMRASGGSLPWASLLTVHSAERNTACDGELRIYLNERNLAALHQQLDQWLDTSWTRFIIAYRQFGPYDETAQSGQGATVRRSRAARTSRRFRPDPRLVQPDEFEPQTIHAEEMDQVDLSTPARFQIDSVLDLIGARILIPSDERLDPSDDPLDPQEERDLIVESPFEDDPAAMQEYLPTLVDRTTTIQDVIINSRINVNLAPRAVLLGVPGLEPQTVQRIIAERGRGIDESSPSYRHATWLLTEEIVDAPQMKGLMPYVTGAGDVFRAQVVGFHQASGLSARAEVVVDATVSPPRQIYWKDVSLLGRGYSLDTLSVERIR